MMKEIIELTKEKISEATEAFYQGNGKLGYTKVTEIATYLLDLNQGVAEAIGKGNLTGYNQNHFIEILTDMMNAMTEQDNVLLSDILQYDMMEELEYLEECL